VPAGGQPASIAVDPSGRFAYAANRLGDSLSSFTINADGSLQPGAPASVLAQDGPTSLVVTRGLAPVTAVPRYLYLPDNGAVSQFTIDGGGILARQDPGFVVTGPGPWAVAAHPNGRFLYSTNRVADTVSQLAISATGALESLMPATLPTGVFPTDAVVLPNGRFLYVANFLSGSLQIYGIGADGRLANGLGPSVGTNIRGLALHPSGRFGYVVTSRELWQYAVFPANGTMLALSPAQVPVPVSSGLRYMAIEPGGAYAYVTDALDNAVVQFAIAADGTLTELTPATIATGQGPDFMTVHPSGRYAYVVNRIDNTVSQYAIGAGGLLQPLVPATVAAGDRPVSMAIEPGGRFAWVGNSFDFSVSQYRIDGSGRLVPLSPAKQEGLGSVGPDLAVVSDWQ
jgi:6-phosphogluconolactonase (cycloisomerase 2 family)